MKLFFLSFCCFVYLKDVTATRLAAKGKLCQQEGGITSVLNHETKMKQLQNVSSCWYAPLWNLKTRDRTTPLIAAPKCNSSQLTSLIQVDWSHSFEKSGHLISHLPHCFIQLDWLRAPFLISSAWGWDLMAETSPPQWPKKNNNTKKHNNVQQMFLLICHLYCI